MNRHIILTSGRSGSNYLANTLNLHPQIVNFGEVLGSWTLPWKLSWPFRRMGTSMGRYLEYIYSSRLFFYVAQLYSSLSHVQKKKAVHFKRYSEVKSLGVKDFFINFELRDVFDFVVRQPEMSVIFLSRTNILRRYLSMLHMQTSKQVLSERGSINIHRLNIDIEHMLKALADIVIEVEKEKAMLDCLANAGHPILHLSYEVYFSSSESISDTNCKVFEFLGLDSIEMQSDHRKILPESFEGIIENYREFTNALQGTVYEKYLL
ncbi:MAG: hypothetical protein JKY80_01820 [Mariprofundaceae bacterium]|nr:hypothetical protein [Mariprofundaceae bacterium]